MFARIKLSSLSGCWDSLAVNYVNLYSLGIVFIFVFGTDNVFRMTSPLFQIFLKTEGKRKKDIDRGPAMPRNLTNVRPRSTTTTTSHRPSGGGGGGNTATSSNRSKKRARPLESSDEENEVVHGIKIYLFISS